MARKNNCHRKQPSPRHIKITRHSRTISNTFEKWTHEILSSEIMNCFNVFFLTLLPIRLHCLFTNTLTYHLMNSIINKKSSCEYDGEMQEEININVPFSGVLSTSGRFAIVESFHKISKRKGKHCIIRSN